MYLPVGIGSSQKGSAHAVPHGRALAPPKVFTTPKLLLKICWLCLRGWGNNSRKLKSHKLATVTDIQWHERALDSLSGKRIGPALNAYSQALKMFKCFLSFGKNPGFPSFFYMHQLLRLSKTITLLQTGGVTQEAATLHLLPEGQKH